MRYLSVAKRYLSVAKQITVLPCQDVLISPPMKGIPPPQGSLGHLERLIEPMEVLEWTVTRLEEPRARRLQVSERPRLRVMHSRL
jgi:hypothetical protein